MRPLQRGDALVGLLLQGGARGLHLGARGGLEARPLRRELRLPMAWCVCVCMHAR